MRPSVWMHPESMESVLVHNGLNPYVYEVEMDDGRGDGGTLNLRFDVEYFKSLGFEFISELEPPRFTYDFGAIEAEFVIRTDQSFWDGLRK